MNPDRNSNSSKPNKPALMMGAIPRKKKKRPLQLPTAAASSAAGGGAPSNRTSWNAPIPRRSSTTDAPIPRRTSTSDAPIPRRPSHHASTTGAPIPRKSSSSSMNVQHSIPRKSSSSSSSLAHPHPLQRHSSAPAPAHHHHQHHRPGGSSGGSAKPPHHHHSSSSHHHHQKQHHHHHHHHSHTSSSISSTKIAPPPWIKKVSDSPLVLRIRTAGMSHFAAQPPASQPPPARTSRAAVTKRPRSAYLEDTDSDNADLLMDTDDEEVERQRLQKRKRVKKMSASAAAAGGAVVPAGTTTSVATAAAAAASTSDTPSALAFLLPPLQQPAPPVAALAAGGTAAVAGMLHVVPLDPNAIQAPPPGMLSALWYSRESFLHVFVMDKICGWKTRPKVVLKSLTATATTTETTSSASDAVAMEVDQEEVKPSPATAAPAPPPPPLTTASAAASEPEKAAAAAATTSTDPAAATAPAPAPAPPPPSTSTSKPVLEPAQAANLQSHLLQNPHIWTDPRKRMEVSRIHPLQCPMVLTLFHAQQQEQKQQKSEPSPPPPRYTLDASEREEVVLVKWRGRSHLHCSWERAVDVQRLDTSNNSTARHKLRRFYQQQEVAHGVGWKQVLEDERAAAAATQLSHHHAAAAAAAATTATETTEEYFSSQCLEIERILACDENQMNMQVLAKQRAMNMRDEQEAMRRKELLVSQAATPATTAVASPTKAAAAAAATSSGTSMVVSPAAGKAASSPSASTTATTNVYETMLQPILLEEEQNQKQAAAEPVWDPEDNVRYVVKWKGLPYAEMTWEYWRDIKRDAVDEAEDFWYRQKSPSPDAPVQAHPHIRDFVKLKESPVYGISSRQRPVADLQPNRSLQSSGSSSNNNNGGGALSATSGGDDEEGDNTNDEGFRLRAYQLEGVNWLLFNWWNKRSCILADEMGLGKTIQSAAFLRELQNQPATQVRGPFLIVAPLSLVGQWQSELHSWAPDMNVVLYHGSADAREFLVQQEFYFTDQFLPKPVANKLKKKHVTKFHILITTYEVVLKDAAVMSKIRWKALVVDEAHRLKNPKARLFEQLANVPRDYCVLLTGTPIANATEELWALLHFANPKVFTDKEKFLERFGEMTDAKQVNELHSLLRPYLLRRVKEDVEKSLPPKEETILEVSLTPTQKTFYKAIYERNTSFLYKGAKPNNAPSLMNVMMELRKCCNHPYLVKGAEDRILAEAAAKLQEKKDDQGNPVPVEVDYVKLFADQLVKSSGKMVLIEKLLQKLFAGGHKVLIFSQMVRVLDLLEELLRLKKYRYERLDGSTSSSSRAHAVERFARKSCKRFVMLLSTRAGGLGLNLTAADVVVIFDSDWNPQNDLQAMARAHRIGQTRAVRVYRLLTAKTYEMHMFHQASLKLGLERAVMSQNREQADESDDNNKSKKKSAQAQAKEIDELLKKGAYDVFRDEDDAEAEKFMETDIDQLLEHSSKQVTYGASATSSLGSGLGSFSKASFVANTEDGAKDVDLDDPDFWSKAVGLEAPEETPEEVAQMIDDGVKRSRKQVQVYDPYADTAEAEQRKKERIALEKMLEQEEKERLKMEKKMKKNEAKEKKKRERELAKNQKLALKQQAAAARAAEGLAKKAAAAKVVKETKPPKPKKSKKSERQRALKRAENTDPMLERLKQAWEVPQRNRATAAAIRFGFARFCKIRSESNLTGLPLQDLESFFRSFAYQLGLQVAVMFLELLKRGHSPDLRSVLNEWLGAGCSRELDWICDSVQTAMRLQLDVESSRRFLRMPVILAETSYARELRQGAALRALRRVGILARLNRFVEDCLDSVLAGLGHEALGRRGCIAGDLTALDPDLKSRLVTTEELGLVVGSFFRRIKWKTPASWWDRRCDIALVIGSFVHGLSNYEAMRNASDLPFADAILKAAEREKGCIAATQVFRSAAGAVRRAFDDALESARVKAELEVQAAVAAALKASTKREEDAAVLRKGGEEAEAVISSMPDTQVEDAFAFDGTDSHFVTLPRMLTYVHTAVRKEAITMASARQETAKPTPDTSKSGSVDSGEGTKLREQELLPMPDARVLDHRLHCILNEIEGVAYSGEKQAEQNGESSDMWIRSNDVQTNIDVRTKSMSAFVQSFPDIEAEHSGIGLGSNQCGSSHRTLNDGSDFAFGSASSELAHVAYGTDAPRYLRALGIPMNVTRFAVAGLVHADASCVKQLLKSESLRYYGKEDASTVSRTGAGDGKLPEDGKTAPSDTAEKPVGIDPTDRMLDAFRLNAKLRANVCCAVLLYGFPSRTETCKKMHGDVSAAIHGDTDASNGGLDNELFDGAKFRTALIALEPDLDVPDVDALFTYVETFLIPHCLRLCINGNGSTTKNARGSHGDYATSFGVSLHPEPSQPHPSPIPDPCLSLHEHSLEALGHAIALLRRVRLLRSCAYLCSGRQIPVAKIVEVTRSDVMGNLVDMPVWWCPWIHDVALLSQAACGGLFSVFPERSRHRIFSPEAVQEFLHSSFIAKERALPTNSRTPLESVTVWARVQSKSFPSLNQLERRLAFLCSRATAESEEARYDNVPMFDHGGWPRN